MGSGLGSHSARVQLVPAHARHIGPIAAAMRAIDRQECAAMGRTPKQALRLGLATSTRAMTARVDGVPHAMFGAVTTSALSGEAVLWMLGSDAVYRHGRELLAWGPSIIAQLCDSSCRASNLVSCGNTRAIRLLRRWGFAVGPQVVTSGGVDFYPFVKRI